MDRGSAVERKSLVRFKPWTKNLVIAASLFDVKQQKWRV